jgi:hypothetical protein
MLEAGRRPHLILKPLHPPRVQQPRKREDLERHAPSERNLVGFVDDSHASAGDLPHDTKIAQCAVDQRIVAVWRKREIAVPRQRPQAVNVLTERSVFATHRQAGQFPHGREKRILWLVKRFESGPARCAQLHMLVERQVSLCVQPARD